MYPRRRWRRSVEWYIYHRLSIGGIQGLEDPRVISVGRRPALAGHYPRPRVCKVDRLFRPRVPPGFSKGKVARARYIGHTLSFQRYIERFNDLSPGYHPSRLSADCAIDFSARFCDGRRSYAMRSGRFFIFNINLAACANCF